MTRDVLFALLALAACHSAANNTADGGATDGTAECSGTCVMQGWWIGVSSNCSVVCMGNPSLTECMQSDCEVIEATRYRAMRESLAPVLFSAQARSFYLIGSLMAKTYSVQACDLQIGSAQPETFSCTTAKLTLPTAMLDAASSAQAGALDNAATANAPGHYTY